MTRTLPSPPGVAVASPSWMVLLDPSPMLPRTAVAVAVTSPSWIMLLDPSTMLPRATVAVAVTSPSWIVLLDPSTMLPRAAVAVAVASPSWMVLLDPSTMLPRVTVAVVVGDGPIGRTLPSPPGVAVASPSWIVFFDPSTMLPGTAVAVGVSVEPTVSTLPSPGGGVTLGAPMTINVTAAVGSGPAGRTPSPLPGPVASPRGRSGFSPAAVGVNSAGGDACSTGTGSIDSDISDRHDVRLDFLRSAGGHHAARVGVQHMLAVCGDDGHVLKRSPHAVRPLVEQRQPGKRREWAAQRDDDLCETPSGSPDSSSSEHHQMPANSGGGLNRRATRAR